MKKITSCIAFLLFFVFVGCQPIHKDASLTQTSTIVPFYDAENQKVEPSFKRQVKVGMLLPLSGKAANLAEDLRNAGILAQFDTADDNFSLSFYDTKGTPEGAREAFRKAAEDKSQVILGPLFSKEVAAIRSLIRRYKIPVFSFSSDIDILGDGVYSLALTIPDQTKRIVRFACEKNARRLAIMAPDNKAGDMAIDTAKTVAEKCGMEVVRLSVYNPTFINFEPYVLSVLPEDYAQIRKEKELRKKRKRMGLEEKKEEELEEKEELKDELDFDALFIADDGNRLKSISSLFGLYDVSPDRVLFLGLSTWDDISLSNEGSLKNAYFPLMPEQGYDVFSDKFKETYGKRPNRLASLAYDAVALASVLTQSENIQKDLIETSFGFLGVDGLVRFNQDGQAERLMEIQKIIAPKKIVRIEKASASFLQEQEKEAFLDEIKRRHELEDELRESEPFFYGPFQEEQPEGLIHQ